jgi:UDP-N-acetylmuramyl pentapeptide phosphotransferase/UDP-N-acetylglucosamine-1-phosphate transferase
MYYLIVFAALFMIEWLYFRIADRFNIIDKPNQRSSHSQITLRGGGVIFPISVFTFFGLHHFSYPWFMVGLAAISVISFADDVQEQSRVLRLCIHTAAVGLLLYQGGVFVLPWYWWPVGFVLVTGIINAFNFMDGINGITTAYSFTVLAALYIVNEQLHVFHENLILFLALGNAVFLFFNFRKKAKCFAGDVGSVSMAFCLLFLTLGIVIKTGSLLFILLFAVYGVDSVLTILHRLSKRENIFEAHRQHLYQYLANEKGWPHLAVSSLYTFVQAAISTGVVFLWKKEVILQMLYAVIVLLILAVIYIIAKRQILNQTRSK